MTAWIDDRFTATGRTLLLVVGAVIAAFVIVLLWRAVQRQQSDRLAVRIAVFLASAFSAQGMYEVATAKLHLVWWLASGLFAVAEMAMLASAVRAHRHFIATSSDGRPGSLGPHSRFVWTIATGAGVIVSLNAHSASEYVLRLCMPLLVAGLWRMGYISPEVRTRAADAVTFAWSPRRIGVALGIIEPGDRDLATVNTDRHIRRLTAQAHALHHGLVLLRPWHAARLRRLALLADDEMVTEAQHRVTRVHYVETSTAPSTTGAAVILPARWWLAPWAHARRSALAVQTEQRRSEQSARDVALRSAEALRVAVDAERSRTTFETERFTTLLRTERAAWERDTEQMRAEHAAAIEDLRRQLAQSIAERAGAVQAQRTGAERITSPRSAPRAASERGGERSNEPKLTDDEAVAVMLRTHGGAGYEWSPREVHRLTGAGFGRVPKLIAQVAEHHARTASEQSDADDSERQLVGAAV